MIMEKRALISSIRDKLGLLDYKTIGMGAGSVSLVKGGNEIIFSYKKYPNVYILSAAIIGYKSFPEVESILQPLYKKHKLGFQNYTIYKISRRFENIALIDLYTPDDLQKIHLELKTMVYEDILPFFDEFTSLHAVHDHAVQLPLERLGHFLVGEVHLKLMVIKRLINSSDWETYTKGVLDFYKEESNGKYKHVFAPINMFLPELVNELYKLNLKLEL